MNRRRDYWLDRIGAAASEADALRIVLEQAAILFSNDPSLPLAWKVFLPSFRTAASNRETTFVIRLFAVYEQGLREIWSASGVSTVPPVRDLIDGLAARHRIPDGHRAAAHRVREYRNAVVHGGPVANASTLLEVRRALCRYFSFLPPTWQH
jgi:hypothetical protein